MIDLSKFDHIPDDELLVDYADNERDILMFELARDGQWSFFDATLYRSALIMRANIGALIDQRGLKRPPGPCGGDR